MEFKLNISDGANSYKQVVKEPEANALIGLKIGDKVNGSQLGLNGYEFIVNGGSDRTGCPMHKGVTGSDRKKILKRQKNGNAIRKSVRGNTISENISQINLVVSKKGNKSLSELLKPAEENDN